GAARAPSTRGSPPTTRRSPSRPSARPVAHETRPSRRLPLGPRDGRLRVRALESPLPVLADSGRVAPRRARPPVGQHGAPGLRLVEPRRQGRRASPPEAGRGAPRRRSSGRAAREQPRALVAPRDARGDAPLARGARAPAEPRAVAARRPLAPVG